MNSMKFKFQCPEIFIGKHSHPFIYVFSGAYALQWHSWVDQINQKAIKYLLSLPFQKKKNVLDLDLVKGVDI